jgi:hypothetical protein
MTDNSRTRDNFEHDSSFAWRLVGMLAIGMLGLSLAGTASADAREQARRIHDRLAGVPPSETVLQQMEASVAAGDAQSAAYLAMENSNFYNVTLKNFAAPWTNREGDAFVPLNDYIATVIGMIRDNVPFNQLLSGNIIYIGEGVANLPPYSNSDNQHYRQMEERSIDLKAALAQRTQTQVTGLPDGATAGIWTTRAAAEAFFVAGTNRAQFRFTMLNHLCNDMEQVHDVKPPPDRIRQDVSRSPGGDSRLYLNNCIGCHNGMDPLAGAFAYYNFDEENSQSLVYTPGDVQEKYFNNDANFGPGFRTTDDSWINYWREGQNQFLGWDENLPGAGFGAKSMGQELANSDAFASCQVRKVFRTVCLRDPENNADRLQLGQMVTSFKGGYSMKQTFADAAVYCMGQ